MILSVICPVLNGEKYITDISLNEDLYWALLTFSKSNEAVNLLSHRKRFLDEEINDFQRSGMSLPLKERGRLKNLQLQHSTLSTKFFNI